ncbi:hypothetical protein LTR95_004367 [Oleoguttula sp. CCFEE 5521]
MAAFPNGQDPSKTIDTDMGEPITTLRPSISSWDLPSQTRDPVLTPSTSPSETSPPVAQATREPDLATRVRDLEVAILTLSLRLSSLEDSRRLKRGASQVATLAAVGKPTSSVQQPQRQDSRDFSGAARTSPSRLLGVGSSRRPEASIHQRPAEELDIFTSLIRSINATRPDDQNRNNWSEAATSGPASTTRQPGTWDAESAVKISQQLAENVSVSTALARASAASKPQRQDSEDSFKAVRRASLVTRRRLGTWDPQRRDAADGRDDDDAEKGECWPEWAEDDFMESDDEEDLRKSTAMEETAEPDWKFWRPQHPDLKTAGPAYNRERNPHNGTKSFYLRDETQSDALVVDDANFPPLGKRVPQLVESWTSIPGLGTLPLPPTTAAQLPPLGDPPSRARARTRAGPSGIEHPLSPSAEKDRWLDLVTGWWTEPQNSRL